MQPQSALAVCRHGVVIRLLGLMAGKAGALLPGYPGFRVLNKALRGHLPGRNHVPLLSSCVFGVSESFMSRMDYAAQDADIDIGRLFAALWRDKLRIVLGVIVLTGLAFAALSMATPQYRSDARILIESGESIFTRPQNEQNASADNAALLDPEGVASQVEILTSSDLLAQVAQDLKLEQNDEFNPVGSMSSLKAGLVALGLVEDPSLLSAEKRVLHGLRERLTVYPIAKSRVIVIEFRSQDPVLAAKVPNALAEAYLALQSRAQLDTTGKAASYLAEEVSDLQKSVREAEAAVASFRASSDLLIGQNSSVLATQQLGELTTELSRIRAERASAEARARNVKAALNRGASIDSLSDIVQSELIGRLREREIALEAQIADLSATLLPGHPRIQGLQSQLQNLSSQIRTEARKILSGLENEAEIERAREQELVADIGQLKAASANAGDNEVELRALEREAASQRALLENYLVRYREAQSRDEGQYAPAGARLISSAVVPVEASFPKMVPMLAAAAFVSLIVMILATLMRELFSGRAFVSAAVPAPAQQVAMSHPVVSAVPPRTVQNWPSEHGIGHAERRFTDTSTSEQGFDDNYGVDALAAHLTESGSDRAIMISPEGDAGAAASVALARRLAGEGLRTVLVDLTVSGAATRRMLHDLDRQGITDLLAASASYAEVIYPDFATGAHVIPTGTADAEEAMKAIDRLPIILDALVSAYDIVIVECGPTNADALNRLVGEAGQIVLSVFDPAAPEIVEAAENLVEGGYEDILLVTADIADEAAIAPQAYRAYAR
ncbi:Wzz/FepE/Etk N-terminal domain-containing protein [Oricola sp.]|uniref:GumC family protein n=1 Tax=Oricola sp. TaxID=1979950 RepID=UPI0025E5D973|nr:Wzz/FepE/Etk N-terminal domain-containing protein [Oricola sp.]MCI5077088.1 Wzz/FepE/Etk N-terminal domain-containing protein [Oricola sp.]